MYVSGKKWCFVFVVYTGWSNEGREEHYTETGENFRNFSSDSGVGYKGSYFKSILPHTGWSKSFDNTNLCFFKWNTSYIVTSNSSS